MSFVWAGKLAWTQKEGETSTFSLLEATRLAGLELSHVRYMRKECMKHVTGGAQGLYYC